MIFSYLIIAIGVVADNFVMVGKNELDFPMFRLGKWSAILFLVFLVESLSLLLSKQLGPLLKPLFNGQEQWVALGILISMGIKMVKEKSLRGRIQLGNRNELSNALGISVNTSIYIFAFGIAMGWLKLGSEKANLLLLLLIAISLTTPFLLDYWQWEKTVKCLKLISPFLILIGAFFLTIEKFLN